ncbi:hypothetical protein C8035_v004689 [Colletotrichum spinosum]|uniref:Uncharacterized protein n=1 Tax=Colletotrichum spinosum TaxID=1347390 RepID=A0A4V6QE99_9PEZI|nr:hypothetical protein C8035_v004689 [Colletotrichum spinosum]
MNINLIKVVNNFKNYNYFNKDLEKLVLYKSNFIILPSPLKVVITTFNLIILLENEAISKVKKIKLK